MTVATSAGPDDPDSQRPLRNPRSSEGFRRLPWTSCIFNTTALPDSNDFQALRNAILAAEDNPNLTFESCSLSILLEHGIKHLKNAHEKSRAIVRLWSYRTLDSLGEGENERVIPRNAAAFSDFLNIIHNSTALKSYMKNWREMLLCGKLSLDSQAQGSSAMPNISVSQGADGDNLFRLQRMIKSHLNSNNSIIQENVDTLVFHLGWLLKGNLDIPGSMEKLQQSLEYKEESLSKWYTQPLANVRGPLSMACGFSPLGIFIPRKLTSKPPSQETMYGVFVSAGNEKSPLLKAAERKTWNVFKKLASSREDSREAIMKLLDDLIEMLPDDGNKEYNWFVPEPPVENSNPANSNPAPRRIQPPPSTIGSLPTAKATKRRRATGSQNKGSLSKRARLAAVAKATLERRSAIDQPDKDTEPSQPSPAANGSSSTATGSSPAAGGPQQPHQPSPANTERHTTPTGPNNHLGGGGTSNPSNEALHIHPVKPWMSTQQVGPYTFNVVADYEELYKFETGNPLPNDKIQTPKPKIRYHSEVIYHVPGSDELLKFTPEFNSQADHDSWETIHKAVTKGYINGKPRSQSDPDSSGITIMSAAQYKACSTSDIQNILSRKGIVVTGTNLRAVGFDREGLIELFGPDAPARDCVAQDFSDVGEDDDPGYVYGSLAEFVEAGKHARYNVLDIPLYSSPDDEHAPHDTIKLLWGYPTGRPFCRKQEQRPISVMTWGLVSSGGCYHPVHVDRGGVATIVEVRCGHKLWYTFTPKDNDYSKLFTLAQALETYGCLEEALLDDWLVEVLVLGPGSTYFQPPGIPHAVLTEEPALVHGGHFFSTGCLQQSVFGMFQGFAMGHIISNADETEADFAQLTRLMACFHKYYVERGEDPDLAESLKAHFPSLDTYDGMLSAVALSGLFELGNAISPWAYKPGFDGSQRLRMVNARSNARGFVLWIFNHFDFYDDEKQLINAKKVVYWEWVGNMAASLYHQYRIALSFRDKQDKLIPMQYSLAEVNCVLERSIAHSPDAMKTYQKLRDVEDTNISYDYPGPHFRVERRLDVNSRSTDVIDGRNHDDQVFGLRWATTTPSNC